MFCVSYLGCGLPIFAEAQALNFVWLQAADLRSMRAPAGADIPAPRCDAGAFSVIRAARGFEVLRELLRSAVQRNTRKADL